MARDHNRSLGDPTNAGLCIREFQMPATDRIAQGAGVSKSLPDILRGLKATRALLVTGRSVGESAEFALIAGSLADAGIETRTHARVIAHNPVENLLELVQEAQAFGPHAIVSVGGGTPVDASKLTALALAAGVTDRESFLDHAVQFRYPDTEFVKEVAGSFIPVVAVPTTLSAAEWDGFASCVDNVEKRKIVFRNIEMTPRVVVLDPDLAAVTPRELWITSGVRAIDHAVESACSIKAHPYATSLALGALDLLGANLAASIEGPDRMQAILNCQIAAGMSIAGIHTVSLGLSHALGHQLGAFGVPHGATSCLTLPHVMRFLEPVTASTQQRIARALSPYGNPDRSAADLVEELFTTLGVPRRIRDFGLKETDLDDIAEHALTDVVIRVCPVKLSRESLRDLLGRAW